MEVADLKKITKPDIARLAKANGYEYAALAAVCMVEGSGVGFSALTGRIIIQFEPEWFKRKCEHWKEHAANSVWFNNGIAAQGKEWMAFNDAFKIDPDAAMQSTSIGMMQVMGFHYNDLGFKTVDEMWDHAKIDEAHQLDLGIRFIKTNPRLDTALKVKDWSTFEYYYNGSGSKLLAKKLKVIPYDLRLKAAYNKILKLS